MTRGERSGTRALPAWQLEGFAIDRSQLAGAECAPEQIALRAGEEPSERGASPVAVFDAEARALADRIRAQVAGAPCRCDLPAGVDDRGRCTRCYGRRPA